MTMDSAYSNPLGWKKDEPAADPNKEEFERAARELYELNVAFKAVFSSKHGQKVLAFLRKATLESATWMSSLPYEQAIAHGFAREGQNALVRDIEHRLDLATRYKSPQEYADFIGLNPTK